MQSDRLKSLRDTLEKERHTLKERIKDMNQEEPLSDSVGDLSSYDNHPADLASETFERDKDMALKKNAQLFLNKVEDALKNMDEGKYGVCEICGIDIPVERLEAVPYTTLCISCKKEEEKFIDPSRRPVEEEVLHPPFIRSDLDDTSQILYDGEDTWQDVARYGTSSTPQDEPPSNDIDDAYTDSHEDRGIVEDVEGVLDDMD